MAGFSIIAKLGLDSSEMQSRIGGLKKKFGDLGDKIGTAVKRGAVVAGAALAAWAIDGTKDLMNFKSKMSEVFSLMPGMSQTAMNAMEADMRKLATTMGVDLIEATEGLYSAISAGVPPENAVSFLGEASKTAIAGVAKLGDSVGVLTTVMDNYKLSTESAGKISDVLFTIVKNGKTTLPELAANIGKVTPLAASLGIAFEDVGGMFATLTKALGEGQTPVAATQIKALIAELGKETGLAAKNFERIAKVSFTEFIAKGGNVSEALKLMANDAKANGKSMIDYFGSIEAGQGAIALTANEVDNLKGSIEEMYNSTGARDTAFELIDKSAARMFAKLSANFKEVGLKLGDLFLPLINDAMPLLLGALDQIAPILGATTTASNATAGGMDVMGRAIKIIIKLVLSAINLFGQWGDTFSFLSKRIKNTVSAWADIMTAGFSPIFVAIEAVIESFKAFGEAIADPSPAAFNKALEEMKSGAVKFIDATVEWGPNINKAFQGGWDDLKKDATEWGDDMVKRNDIWKDIWEESGDFAFLAGKAAKGASGEMGAPAGAALATGAGLNNANRNIWGLKPGAKNAADEINGPLVAAILAADGAAGGLKIKIDAIQAAAKEARDFWEDAAKKINEVFQGQGALGAANAIVGAGAAVGAAGMKFNDIVRKLGAKEAALRGGVALMAALPWDKLMEVEKAAEHSMAQARILQTVYELQQRASDVSKAGMDALTEEIRQFEEAMKYSTQNENQLTQASKKHLEWLRARRDIALENIALAIKGVEKGQEMVAKMDEVESLLGSLTDELMKPLAERDNALISKLESELAALTGTITAQKEKIEGMAEAAGIDPLVVENVARANRLLEEAEEVRKNTEKTSTYDLLSQSTGYLKNIDKNVESIVSGINDVATALENLDLSECCEKGEGEGGGGGGGGGNSETTVNLPAPAGDGSDAGTDVDLPAPAGDGSDAGTDVDLPAPAGDGSDAGTDVDLPAPAGDGSDAGTDVDLPAPAGDGTDAGTEIDLPAPAGGGTDAGSEIDLPPPAGGEGDGDEVKLPGGDGGGGDDGDEVKLPGGGGGGDGEDEVKLPGGDGGGGGGEDEVKLPGEGGGGDGDDEVKLPGEDGGGDSGGLALEETQLEVLDTLQGYFVNQ